MFDDILNKTVAVVGLGYVGLPLALAFGSKIQTLGYDIDSEKLTAYREGYDPSGELKRGSFAQAKKITYSSTPSDISRADFIIIAVPTPIDAAKQPDLAPIISATELVAQHLKQDAIVIYESTVYPGVTEDCCGPVLEKISGKKRGVDFKLAYSPERIVPGDRQHQLENIVKVVSGEDNETLEAVASLYSLIIDAGVHRVSSIRVAEAVKVIENTQRDVNIALMNELAIILNLMGLDTLEVLEGAGTKWNFLPFRPGLVGGHCIGVDPYYLTHKVQTLGYNPEVILSGRRVNDRMGSYIAQKTLQQMMLAGSIGQGAVVLVLGLTFKENCADIRNTKVMDIINELKSHGCTVKVWDPVADRIDAEKKYDISLISNLDDVPYADAIIAAVAHDQIKTMDLGTLPRKRDCAIPFMDVKSIFPRAALEARGYTAWRL